MNICFEIYMYECIQYMLNKFTKEIMNILNSNDFSQIYYLVVKFYIYHLGISCNLKYPLLVNVNIDYSWLIKDISNTLKKNIDYKILDKLFSGLLNNIIEKLKIKIDYCDHKLAYKNNKLTDGKYIFDLDSKLYDKLKKSFTGDEIKFLEYTFVMLLRYQLFGNKKETINLSADFVYSNKELTFDVELFGSPINRNLQKYCSLFPDIEKYFGSIGSIFCADKKIWIENKYFVANPPFDECLMFNMAKLIINVLDEYQECCFIIIIPDWRAEEGFGEYTTYTKLRSSKYFISEKIGQYGYYNYFKSKFMQIGRTNTIILVLSNFKVKINL